MTDKTGESELKRRANEVHVFLADELNVPCFGIKGRRLARDKEQLDFSLCSSSFILLLYRCLHMNDGLGFGRQ